MPGFRVSAAACGMRYRGRTDLALIAAQSGAGCTASGVFTRNRFAAAPVLWCRERLKGSRAGAILANAGIANACTGAEGLKTAGEMARLAGEALGMPAESVLVASTGVIGNQVVLGPVAEAMPGMVASLRPDGWEDAARAIMTTDTAPKMASLAIELSGKMATIGGIAKGSGMIAPDMATLLAFVCTDASLDPKVLDYWTRRGADRSFNRITVDGDTSTNDTLIVLAGGAAGNPTITDPKGREGALFGEALALVLEDLARQLVLDAEGATKFIEIEVSGASDPGGAKAAAFTIANSPLVKTAFFGEDANWGRIVAAAGRAGVALDPERVALYFGDLCVFRNGTPVQGEDVEEKAAGAFRQKKILVRFDLGMGDARFSAFTCDLSYDYVKINASYRS